ncbi:MAG: hypothetical protein A3J28_02030 [Acidobacteria bacterium RIFCSPLOWO2_12_FULL_60_22]|nr:MAG: hypothetical protein A3J28_02030 [Acidobacteria bacterium RIFCSPLOWO2_12_FULL_60_22]
MKRLVAFALLAALTAAAQERHPYQSAHAQSRDYNGPESSAPGPEVREVRIGYYGPSDAGHPEGGTLWLGVSLALEEANREGGYQGLPFRLVPDWSESPWLAGSAAVVRMAYGDQVWAVIGSLDGASTHLAEQVAAKARLVLLNPVSTDKSVNYAGIPWMFSCAPSDGALAAVMGDAALQETAGKFVLVNSTDHDARSLAAELQLWLSDHHAAPMLRLEFQPRADLQPLASQVAASGAKAVVVLAGASDAGRFVRELRRGSSAMPVFGGASLARRSFALAAGAEAGDVRFPQLVQATPRAAEFATRFRARFGFAPDYPAFYGYDAMQMMVTAVRKAGLSRSGIRQALQNTGRWEGVSGSIEWDPAGRNQRSVSLSSGGIIR